MKKKIEGQYGDYGFLSKLDFKELGMPKYKLDDIMMYINLIFFDEIADNTSIGKAISKLENYHVDVDLYHKKLIIRFPLKVGRNKRLSKFYLTAVKTVLASYP